MISLRTKINKFSGSIRQIRLEPANGNDPLTNLPGKILLNQELLRHMAANHKFSVIYVNLHKKNFTDKYCFAGGKLVTVFTSKVLIHVVKKYGKAEDFIAHIKENEFVIITERALADNLCRRAVKYFDSLIGLACNNLELIKNKEFRSELAGGYPFIVMSIIDIKEGEKAFLGNIINGVKHLKLDQKTNHGSIYMHESINKVKNTRHLAGI
ncbi:MAG: hypothetical protein A4E53_02438 [Pelotomaculum sp. PtaB.Bin104]|nr:MAG: hypothetical protein A4E53_02438 [Pelotomaculum sp. PtaB.Bin104]